MWCDAKLFVTIVLFGTKNTYEKRNRININCKYHGTTPDLDITRYSFVGLCCMYSWKCFK